MKYIRTKDGKIVELKAHRFYKYVLEGEKLYLSGNGKYLYINNVVSQSDTIEELCDEFVIKERTNVYDNPFEKLDYIKNVKMYKHKIIYGAIWTDKGLIYVARINKKGELELL